MRLLDYHYSPLKIVRRATLERDDRYAEAFRSTVFIFDPYLIWRPRKAVRPFNAIGYIGNVLDREKKPGTYRVLAVGDSNTQGHPDGASWPLLLGASDSRLEVINAGVVGYSSFQGLRRLRESLSFRPDMVLVSFGSNDAHIVHLSDADYARTIVWRERLWKAGSFLRTLQLLVDADDHLSALARRGPPVVHRVEIADYRANLEEMIRTAVEMGMQPVLLTRPFRGSSDDPMSWKAGAPAYNDATREVAKRKGVPLVDLWAFFSSRGELFQDESHFTGEGHRVAAEYVYGQIRELLPPRP